MLQNHLGRKTAGWGVVYVLLFAAGWCGMNFSPSVTLMLLVAGLAISIFGTGFTLFDITNVFGKTVIVFASLLALPAVYIYAFGDDYLNVACIGALIGGVLMVFVLQKWKAGSALCGLGRFMIWITACFTILSSWSSPALIPYGIGLALQGIAWELPRQGNVKWVLYGFGLGGAAVFSAAPMIF
ncbi:MAG: hypothetical protein Q4B26_04945 [Eubacteriales bacterium]|nr:hypothetical protein [Eubacteriales bacterium]